MGSLTGRTVLITGATGGLGRVATSTAADAGARVVLVGRDDARLREVAGNCPPGVATTHVVDVTDADAVTQLAQDVGDELDAVWHLVGGWRGGAPIDEQPSADWDWLHAQLVRSTVNLARALAGPLAERDAGRFVIVSSPQAQAPTSTNAAYAAAKAGAEATVLALANRFKGSSATANVIVVPSIGTTSSTAVPPDDIAAALLYLTTDAAAKMNGQRIRLYAGGPS